MKKADYPLVSIVTVNYNQTSVTRDLLVSLKAATYPNTEIIVVDNGSSDQSITSLKEEFPAITLILTGKNLGFAGGNNRGIEVGKGDFFLLINNDVEVTPGFLEPLVETLQHYPAAGMASSKIVYHNRDEQIQYAGSLQMNAYTGRGKKIGNLEKDHGQHDEVRKTELGHGACLIVSRKVIEKIGLMPEIYFLYYEEHDWTEQAKRNGFDVYFVGTSKIYHKESVSTGRNTPLKTFYLTRNRLLYLRRNSSGITFVSSLLFFILFSTPKNILNYLLKRDFANLNSYLKAVVWHLKNVRINHA